jgi:hypothetical protein
MTQKKSTVATPNQDWLEMQDNFELVDILMQGTDALRAAGTRYLPREPKESQQAYRNRLARSFLYNAFADTTQKMVGKPFSKPVIIKQTTPEIIADWCKNIDLCGSNITTFAREVFDAGLRDGLTHILVDFPRNETGGTLADEKAAKLRPYCINILAKNLFAWRAETINGAKQITQIRIRETIAEPDGDWGEKLIHRIRVIYPERFELYQLESKDKWVIVDKGDISLNRIALVTFYTGKTGFMTAKPPLLDLAHLNIQHWQSSSDQEHILHFIRFPLLHGAGFNQDQKEIEIGPNRMIISEDPQAKLSYVEHSGKAVEAGRQAICDIEEKMDSMGAQLLLKRPGASTATAASLDTAQSHSSLQDMVRKLENAFSEVLTHMGQWFKLTADDFGGIDINQDFGLSLVSGKDEDLLLKSRMSGELSRESYLTELKRRGVLREEIDIQEEMELIESEGASFNEPPPLTEDDNANGQ